MSQLLCRQDLKMVNGELRVTLHWSKTNQFGEHLVFSLPEVENSVLCPVTAICNMIALVPGRTDLCF